MGAIGIHDGGGGSGSGLVVVVVVVVERESKAPVKSGWRGREGLKYSLRVVFFEGVWYIGGHVCGGVAGLKEHFQDG